MCCRYHKLLFPVFTFTFLVLLPRKSCDCFALSRHKQITKTPFIPPTSATGTPAPRTVRRTSAAPGKDEKMAITR